MQTTHKEKQKVPDIKLQSSDTFAVGMHALVMRRSEFGFFFPLITKLVEICLSAPINNAWPERGTSAIKQLKTRPKNRIKNMLNSLSACSYPWLFTPAKAWWSSICIFESTSCTNHWQTQEEAAGVPTVESKEPSARLQVGNATDKRDVSQCRRRQLIRQMTLFTQNLFNRIFLKFWSWIVLLVLICMVCICSHAFQTMVENMPHLANNVTRCCVMPCHAMPCHAMYATTAC